MQNATAQNNAPANNAIANAMNTASAAMKANEAQDNSPALVCRVDLLSNKVVFLVNTQDREANTIQFWAGKKGDKTLVTAPLDFYKSTRPIDNEEAVKKLVQDFSSTFGHKTVILRQRLVKANVLDRNEGGSVEKKDLDAWKLKLVEALKKTIMEM